MPGGTDVGRRKQIASPVFLTITATSFIIFSSFEKSRFSAAVKERGSPERMLYRPKFCAECGERIMRVDWPLFASRRFCELCSSVNKGADLLPRAVAAIGIFIGLLGIAFATRTSIRPKTDKREVARNLTNVLPPQNQVRSESIVQAPSPQATPVALPEQRTVPTGDAPPSRTADIAVPLQPVEEKYRCGAQTKKGTPCSRRVKGPKRCYQHEGMPAMVGQNELRVK